MRGRSGARGSQSGGGPRVVRRDRQHGGPPPPTNTSSLPFQSDWADSSWGVCLEQYLEVDKVEKDVSCWFLTPRSKVFVCPEVGGIPEHVSVNTPPGLGEVKRHSDCPPSIYTESLMYSLCRYCIDWLNFSSVFYYVIKMPDSLLK